VQHQLRTLQTAGVQLGLVTSNIRDNVTPALSNSMTLFDERCLFFFDKYPIPKTKAWYLAEGIRVLEISSEDCVYVGDQPEDARAASEAGIKFLGVTYGWGISDRDRQYRSAKNVWEIPDKLRELYVQSKVDNSRLASNAP
jgi:phosphoglycolate phosphatase-like HAD superfamily hydrolase